MDSVEEFYTWTFEVRGDECFCVNNQPVGDIDGEEAKATFWSEDEMGFPEGVDVLRSNTASGEAPAVANKDVDVEGWHKYFVVYDG